MILFQPFWLIMLIPAAIILYLWPSPVRSLLVIRAVVLALLVLIMADPAIHIDDRQGTVVVIADRSHSMPNGSTDRILEGVDIIRDSMPTGNKMAVVSMGEAAGIDMSPGIVNSFDNFISTVNPQGSNLYDAIKTASSLVDKNSPGRLVVFSDGLWSGTEPYSAATSFAGRDIAIDHRFLGRKSQNDLAIVDISAPLKVMPGQAYLINAVIQAPATTEISYELVRANTVVARGKSTLSEGSNQLTFRDMAGMFGNYNYTLKIIPNIDDPILENNSASFLTSITSNKPILAVSKENNSALVQLLAADGINIVSQKVSQTYFDLDILSGYSALILEDVNANDLGTLAMENIAAWVTQTGAGLIMTGGPDSYGPGGYFRSPIEPIMPVTMELRREHRKMNMAIAIVLDRSGSMTAPVGNGMSKMDLANTASAEVLSLMSPFDELGVIAVDSQAHIIAQCKPVGEDTTKLRNNILSINSMGGGIFVYEGLVNAAAMLNESVAQNRHIILFADAADAEQPGDYKNLLAECQDAGITVSVIGLGSESDSDADFLKDVALRGQGRCFFSTDPMDLPRLFAQDTFMVARNSFIIEPTGVNFTAAISTIMEIPTYSGSIGGYNLCYSRPQSDVSVITTDGYDAPILATWQTGLGRVAAICAQADGSYAGDFAQWGQVGKFYSSVARWAIARENSLGNDVVIEQTVGDGVSTVRMYVDPDKPEIFTSRLPELNILTETPGMAPKANKVTFRYEQADVLVADIPLNGSSVVVAAVDAGELGTASLAPVCQMYSPEYEPASDGKGLESLDRLSRMTGGNSLTDLTGIWNTITPRPVYHDLTSYLTIFVIILFLMEILQRRTGVFEIIAKLFSRKITNTNESEQTQQPVTGSQPSNASSQGSIFNNLLVTVKKVKRQKEVSTNKKSHIPTEKTAKQQESGKIQNVQSDNQPPDQTQSVLDAMNKIKKKR